MSSIVVAIDSMKGCLSSAEANHAATAGIRSYDEDIRVTEIPVSDGGEGWLVAFDNALHGDWIEVAVRDPLMREIKACYIVKDDLAVIEIAQACGLSLLSPDEYDPMIASSYGVGQLVVDAVQRGCKRILVGLGGSSVSDCGVGMLNALKKEFLMKDKWDSRPFENVQFTIATDVTNPLCGERGAAHVFAPQKGATREMVFALDAKAKRFAEESSALWGYDRQQDKGAGAAGGIGYAFLQYLHAEYRSGVDLLLETISFDEILCAASLVITGEGSADRQTLMGKLPYGILKQARRKGIPVALIAGRVNDCQQLLEAGFSYVKCINPTQANKDDALKPAVAKKNIENTLSQFLREVDYGN